MYVILGGNRSSSSSEENRLMKGVMKTRGRFAKGFPKVGRKKGSSVIGMPSFPGTPTSSKGGAMVKGLRRQNLPVDSIGKSHS